MWSFLKGLVQPIVAVVLIPWLKTKVIRNEVDTGRFYLISAIAEEAASEVVQRRPNDEVADLIQEVIRTTRGAWPTTNEDVIYRAASRAVRDMIRTHRGEVPAQ